MGIIVGAVAITCCEDDKGRPCRNDFCIYHPTPGGLQPRLKLIRDVDDITLSCSSHRRYRPDKQPKGMKG